MIDLEKLLARASGLPDSDGAIGPTWCTPAEVLELLDHIAQLERDAGRLDWMIEQRAYVVSDETCCDGYWLNWARPDGTTWTQANEHETPRQAIDTAMEAKHG